jgi:hypothetical protein
MDLIESTNPRNMSLYRRHGFEVLGRIHGLIATSRPDVQASTLKALPLKEAATASAIRSSACRRIRPAAECETGNVAERRRT